jgi:hypothetical protein
MELAQFLSIKGWLIYWSMSSVSQAGVISERFSRICSVHTFILPMSLVFIYYWSISLLVGHGVEEIISHWA